MEQISILSTIPLSKRAYFVKKQSRLPSGDRNDPQILDEPWYWVMRRPVDRHGHKNAFYGNRTESYCGPFSGDKGKAKAKQIAQCKNEYFHTSICQCGQICQFQKYIEQLTKPRIFDIIALSTKLKGESNV